MSQKLFLNPNLKSYISIELHPWQAQSAHAEHGQPGDVGAGRAAELQGAAQQLAPAAGGLLPEFQLSAATGRDEATARGDLEGGDGAILARGQPLVVVRVKWNGRTPLLLQGVVDVDLRSQKDMSHCDGIGKQNEPGEAGAEKLLIIEHYQPWN